MLATAALAVCAVIAAHARTTTGNQLAAPPAVRDDAPPANPGLIPLTVAEMKRLVNLLTRTWHDMDHHLPWHIWRRRHQARARWYHYRVRLAANDKITISGCCTRLRTR